MHQNNSNSQVLTKLPGSFQEVQLWFACHVHYIHNILSKPFPLPVFAPRARRRVAFHLLLKQFPQRVHFNGISHITRRRGASGPALAHRLASSSSHEHSYHTHKPHLIQFAQPALQFHTHSIMPHAISLNRLRSCFAGSNKVGPHCFARAHTLADVHQGSGLKVFSPGSDAEVI